LLGAETAAAATQKVPSAVKICVLKLPQVTTAFPPVAFINSKPVIFCVEPLTDFHPLVPST
jgi:hypothetical protein